MRGGVAGFALVLLAFAACERTGQSSEVIVWRPFPASVGDRLPTPAEYAAAISGTGGTASDRELLRSLALEFIWPEDGTRTLESLNRSFTRRHDDVRSMVADGVDLRRAAFVELVDNAAYILSFDTLDLARDRAAAEGVVLHRPRPAPKPIPVIEAEAVSLAARLERLRQRTEHLVPAAFWDQPLTRADPAWFANVSVRRCRDNLRIASRGDYSRSNWDLYDDLRAHGIQTTATPMDRE